MAINTDAVQRLYVAYFNRPADPVGLAYWEGQLSSTVAATQAQLTTLAAGFSNSAEYVALYAGQSNAQIINNLYLNLFGRAAEPAGLISWSGKLTAGTETFASIALQLTFSAQGTDATAIANKLSAATTFTTALDTSAEIIGYAGTAAAASGRAYLAPVTNVAATLTTAVAGVANAVAAAVLAGAPAAAGASFTLTTGSNIGAAFTGGSGDDNFDGGLGTGALQTLNSGDQLNGGGGTDTLQAVVNGSVTPAALTSIENINITAITNAATVDLTNATGVVNVVNQASTSALTLSGISKAIAVTVQDTSAAGQVITYNDVTGSADAATVALKNASGAATLTVAGVETLTLNSAGSGDNVLTTLTTAAATKLNVTGNQALNAGTLGATILTLDASGMTVTGTGVTAVLAGTSASTITGSAGNDTITFGSAAAADSISAGAGDDTIIFTANFTTADTVNGGNGTDTLRAISSDLVTASASTPTTYTVTSVETIQATTQLAAAASLTATNISTSANRVNLALTGADITGATGTIVGSAGAFTLGLGGSAAGNTAGQLANLSTLTVNDTGTAITDALTITHSAIDSTTGLNINVYDSSIIAVGGYETVTINTGSVAGSATSALGTVTVTGDVGGTAAETVNFTGANIVTVGVITADIVNASALTAGTGTVITMVTGSTATTVTGSAGIDILFGNTTVASSIVGGAGNDTITAGSGNDTVLGGDGLDTITTGGGATDSIDGGAGNDTVIATLTAGNTMHGGADTDTLSLAVAATAATATGVSSFEVLTATAAITQDMAVFLDNSTFTRLNNSGTGTVSFTNVGAGVTTYGLNGAATMTWDRLVDTSTNAATIILTGAAAVTATAITVDDEETLTITGNAAADDLTITNLTSTDLKTLTITGAGDVIFSNAIISATLLATVNASAATGAVTVNGGTSLVGTTATGGTGVFTYTGGAGADAITGGNAADALVGGAGADTMVGGAGADTIDGGAGIDKLTGGAGADHFRFINSITSGTPGAATADRVTDWLDGTDFIAISIANTFGSGGATGLTAGAGVAGAAVAIAAGATVVQSLGAASAGTALTAGVNLIKLTSQVATGDTDQAAFNTAIGTSTILLLTQDATYLVALYDVTLGQMVLMDALITATADTTLQTGDVVRVVGRIDMSSDDYTNFTTADILFY